MLFEPQAEKAVVESIRAAKASGRDGLRAHCARACDYMEGRMRDDVIAELQHRFPRSQAGQAGQEIKPITVPLVQRYVEEAADTYNREVRRYFTDENGEESDATREQTTKMQHMLEPARYEEVMHRNEQLMQVMRGNCVWYEAKRGKLRAVPRLTCDVYPVASSSPAFVEASDPDDYAGFIMELFWASDDVGQAQKRTFAYVTAAETVFYVGRGPNEIDDILSRHPNPYRWPQVVDVYDSDGSVKPAQEQEAPGLMLTFWQPKLPMGSLIPETDLDLVETNREINVALSALLDVIRFQGHGVMVKKLANPSDPKAFQPHGVRFPAVIDIASEIQAVSFANDYTGQIGVLKDLVQMLAMLKRMSPNDFSIDGAPMASGFAKLVDSLPKLEARRERQRPLYYYEQHVAAPRLVAIGTTLGLLDQSAKKMRLRCQFADVEFPETQDERTKRLETDIKHNLTTPAHELAKVRRITVEEAQAVIDENREKNQVDREQAMQGGPAQGLIGVAGGAFGGAIRRTARPAAQPAKE